MRDRGRHAFTLIETVLSLGIVGIIALAMTSVVLLTGKAMPSAADADVANVTTREVAQRIAGEVAAATQINAVSATSIRFTLPDRDGDNIAEVFEYAWSGTPGDPLRWTYNSEAPISIATGIQAFTIALDQEPVSQSGTGAAAWGSEQVLYEYYGPKAGASGVLGLASCAQYFKPTLPADATGWTVTRASVWIRRAPGATFRPELQAGIAGVGLLGEPLAVNTQATTGSTAGVTGTAFVPVVFTCTTTPTYAPGVGVFLRLAPITLATNATNAGEVGFDSAVAAHPAYFSTTTTGLTWTHDQDGGMACVIMGRVLRPLTTTSDIQRATRVQIGVTLTGVPEQSASARMLNRPEVP